MSEPLVIAGPGDIVAVIPHMLGARPENSVIVFPVDHDRPRPVVRLGIPEDLAEHRDVAAALADSYAPYAGGQLMVVAFTDRLERATSICEAVTRELEPGSTVVGQIATQGDTWLRLGSGLPSAIAQGTITQADRDRIAVAYVGAGARPPYDSLDQLRASFNPTGEDLSDAVAAATEHIETGGVWEPVVAAEERWMSHAIEGFIATGRPLPSTDAARLIADVQTVRLRDHAFMAMAREEAGAHAALWKDLLTRCPEEPRTPVASLAAFGAWLRGDGMGARHALERVTDPTNRMAQLVRAMVELGVNPANYTPPEPASRGDAVRDTDMPRHDPRREPPVTGGGTPDRGPRR